MLSHPRGGDTDKHLSLSWRRAEMFLHLFFCIFLSISSYSSNSKVSFLILELVSRLNSGLLLCCSSPMWRASSECLLALLGVMISSSNAKTTQLHINVLLARLVRVYTRRLQKPSRFCSLPRSVCEQAAAHTCNQHSGLYCCVTASLPDKKPTTAYNKRHLEGIKDIWSC